MWYTHRPIAKARFPGRNSEGLRVGLWMEMASGCRDDE